MVIPHDLLPITRPLEDDSKPDKMFFYGNVVKQLIPDIIKMEANGIPIDLSKVAELEGVLNDVLLSVTTTLHDNQLVKDFLSSLAEEDLTTKKEDILSRKKTLDNFIKPFNISNKLHRSYVVNSYLKANKHEDMCLEDWSVKDLKKLNQILASKFVQSITDKIVDISMIEYIDAAMLQLAQDKADIYNKSHVEEKITSLKKEDVIRGFNPSSSTQKQKFFTYYGIESENETTSGNPQWDRSELERVQKLLNMLIESKEGK